MSNRIDDLMYEAGLLADGCWDQFDQYDKEAIHKFANLIIKECIEITNDYNWQGRVLANRIKERFGIENE